MKSTLRRGVPERPQRSATGRLYIVFICLHSLHRAYTNPYSRTLSQRCADKLIQDAIMFRFLIFPNQNSLSWQDEILLTEKFGEGKAFPEITSANRKVGDGDEMTDVHMLGVSLHGSTI